MPSIEKRVSQSADDGRIFWTGSSWNYSATDTDHTVGYQSSSYFKYSNWQLFRNIIIPKGATILAAKLTYICRWADTATVVRTKIRAVNQDNPSPPSSASDYLARPLTSAVLNWDDIPPWSAEQVVDSPDFKDVIQELVNRDNWQSGNNMLLFWDDRDNRSDHAAMRIRRAYSYDKTPTKAPLLTIEYSTAPPPPEIQTQDATNIKSDEAMLHTKVIDDQGETLSVRHNYGKTTAYGMNTPWQDGKHTDDIISQVITDLDPETEYHFRGEAVYNSETIYGDDKQFATQAPPPPPEIQTQDATNIKSDEAILHTKVVDDKGKTLSVRHNWGKTTGYGDNTPWQEGKHTNDIISQKITGLDPETEHHFRGEAIFED